MDQRPRSHAAFTLIELLIVIGIISLLIAISVVVGTKVVGTGKKHATEGIIKALDTSLAEMIAATGGIPPAYVGDPRTPGGTSVIPVADAINTVALTSSHQSPPLTPSDSVRLSRVNSVGLYMLQCKGVPAADSMIQGLDPKYVRQYDPDGQANAAAVSPDTQPALLTVFDGWGNPIRYVHPAFKGNFQAKPTRELVGEAPIGKSFSISNLRRMGKVAQDPARPGDPQPPPDADAGKPHNNRPYFYSTGPDGKAGYEYDPADPTYRKILNDFNLDNVFVATPGYEK